MLQKFWGIPARISSKNPEVVSYKSGPRTEEVTIGGLKTNQFFFYTSGPLPWIKMGFLNIPTYFFVISLSCCLCVFWFYRRCRSFGLSQEKGMELGLILLVTGFIGARLVHIFFENPSHYLSHPVEIFYFWQGGFVFYGGALLAYLSVRWIFTVERWRSCSDTPRVFMPALWKYALYFFFFGLKPGRQNQDRSF